MTYPRVGRVWRRAALFVAWAGLGCSSEVGVRGPGGAPPTIDFEQTGVLALAPKQIVPVELTANVTPITLSLAGNYLDAYLESDVVNVSEGMGSFVLHAPSSASTFSVLAVSGATTARLDVAVSAVGFATVRVTVDYQGSRPVPAVEASAFIETTCTELANATTDGAPLVEAASGDELAIPSVPTDGQVAINVRIAHYAVGCVDVGALVPGETRDVTVSVFDLPFDLAHTSLETRFTFAPSPSDAMALQSYLDGDVSNAILGASFPNTSNEAAELLGAMAAASTSPSEFANARSSGGWDTLAQTWLGARPPTMNMRASTWLHDAFQAGVGDLTGHLVSDPSNPTFVPKAIGAIDATKAGIAAPLPFAWSGEAGDVLAIGGVVMVPPSTLACALADVQAATVVPMSTGVASAMALDVDCTGLGETLVPTGYAYGTCNAACIGALCDTALTNMWSAGAAALSNPVDAVLLSITAAAPAQVGDTANVQSFAGAWVGSFTTATSTIDTQGSAKGAYGATPN